MVSNATFNKIFVAVSFIGGGNWRTGENHRPVARHWQSLWHIVVHLVTDKLLSHHVVSSSPRLTGLEITTLVVIDTDCIGCYNTSNYHMITITTALLFWLCFVSLYSYPAIPIFSITIYIYCHFCVIFSLLTCWRYVHGCIILLRRDVWK